MTPLRIVHICLCGPVTDGWTYQDNLLPKHHRLLGHDVSVITSQWIRSTDGRLVKTDRTAYDNADGVRMIRLAIRGNRSPQYKFRRFAGLRAALEAEQPDLLFIHNVAFADTDVIVRYLRTHPDVRVLADNHSDFSNSARGPLSRRILHGVIWRHCAQRLLPYTAKFYGVLPARVDFLAEQYGIPRERCALLPLGADDGPAEEAARTQAGAALRAEYGIAPEEFLVVTGGKIDSAKRQTLLLMEAVVRLPGVRLLIFGPVDPALRDAFDARLAAGGGAVLHTGWIAPEATYAHLAAADLAVFPGRHSALWEQAAGQGIPLLCRYWEGTTHVNAGGNARFLTRDSADEMAGVIGLLSGRGPEYRAMRQAAERCRTRFLYSGIAAQTLRDIGLF